MAEQAIAELRSAGFNRVEISSADVDRDAHDTKLPASEPDMTDALVFKAHESAASSFIDELAAMGFDKHDAHDLIDAMTAGGAIVTADAAADPERAVGILTKHYGDIRYASAVNEPANASDFSNGDVESVIRLRAERLEIQKHRVQHGEARAHKEVVTHLESIEVPVSREELVIEQVSFNDDGTESEIGVGDTIRIPLSEEVVNVTKTVAVTEDVRIGKRFVQENEHVSETTREERLRVNETPPTSAD